MPTGNQSLTSIQVIYSRDFNKKTHSLIESGKVAGIMEYLIHAHHGTKPLESTFGSHPGIGRPRDLSAPHDASHSKLSVRFSLFWMSPSVMGKTLPATLA
eukprot:c6636_g1_i1 orf=2-298(-)